MKNELKTLIEIHKSNLEKLWGKYNTLTETELKRHYLKNGYVKTLEVIIEQDELAEWRHFSSQVV